MPLCKVCKLGMDVIKDQEHRKLYYCDDCDLFFDADTQEEIGNCLDGNLSDDSPCWKKLQEPMAYRVTYWIGNGKTCSCHRKQEVSYKDFYSLEEAKSDAVHFLADGFVKDGNIMPTKANDRGIVSIYQVGSEDFYVSEEIVAMVKVEVEMRMSDGGSSQ